MILRLRPLRGRDCKVVGMYPPPQGGTRRQSHCRRPPQRSSPKMPKIIRFDSKMVSDDGKHVLGIRNDVWHDQKLFSGRIGRFWILPLGGRFDDAVTTGTPPLGRGEGYMPTILRLRLPGRGQGRGRTWARSKIYSPKIVRFNSKMVSDDEKHVLGI